MRRKLVSALLISGMVLGMAACKSKPVENTGASQNADSGKAQTQEAASPAKVSVLTVDFSGNALGGENTQQILDYLTEYTDTELEVTFGLSDTYDEKLTLMLASGDETPMIVTVEKLNPQVIDYAKAGAFWNLIPFINAEDYPNLAQMNPDIMQHITVDGQLIGIYRGRDFGRYSLGVRKDWAEKLGYTKEPQTIDEVYQLMYDMTYGDPDGNGKNDTYGLELCSYMGPLDIMQTWFGVGNGWYEDETGKLMPVHMSAEYMEALNWFKKCYDEGLWASDWATRETSTWTNDVKNGLAGMYCDTTGNSRRIWEYFIDNNVPSVMDASQTASMQICHSIGKTADDRHNLANSGYGGFFVITKSGAKTEEDVKNCLHFLDRMCEADMMMLTTYGLEGLHWERGEGDTYVDLKKDAKKEEQDYAGLNQMLPQIPNVAIPADYIQMPQTEPVKIANEMVVDNAKYAVSNPALSLLMQSDTYAMSGGSLDTIISDARTNYIIGNISEDELKAQWDIWFQNGGEKIIEEVNTAASK